MTDQSRQTLFSFDCGASNWRLFRTEYQVRGERAEVIAAPRPAPLSGFVDRRLPAAVLLAPAGDALERFGADAERALAGEATRSRVREYFRPSIGAHLVSKPLPHQRRYTHAEALQTTRMLLLAVLVQLRREALGGAAFDDRVRFAFAYPVQWRYEHGGRAFEDFRRTVLSCFPADLAGQVRFVAEPDGAFLGLRRQGMLAGGPEGAVTLIVDVGGSTTDVIAGRVDAGTGAMRFLGSYGAPFGGGLYDAEIAPLIADTLRIPASSLVHDAGAMTALRAAGQRIKEALSWQMAQSDAPGPPPRRSIELALRDGEARRGVIELDTATFHAATGHLTTGFDRLMAAATRSIGVEDWEIGRVLAIGAGVQLFVLVDHLRQRFGSRVVLVPNGDEVVARGVGLEYELAPDRAEETILLPPPPRPTDTAAPASDGRPARRVHSPLSPLERWRLVSADGDVSFVLEDGDRVGRDPANEIWLDDMGVSRHHAEFLLNNDVLSVVDLDSANGTRVNGERIEPHRPRILRAGDELAFAGRRFFCAR